MEHISSTLRSIATSHMLGLPLLLGSGKQIKLGGGTHYTCYPPVDDLPAYYMYEVLLSDPDDLQEHYLSGHEQVRDFVPVSKLLQYIEDEGGLVEIRNCH